MLHNFHLDVKNMRAPNISTEVTVTNTITTTINTTVILGSTNYPGPLTITSTGGAIGSTASPPGYTGSNTTGNTGNAGVQVSLSTLTNAGNIIGGTGSKDDVQNFYGHPGMGGAGVSQSGGVVVNTGTVTGGTGGFGDAHSTTISQYGGNGGYGVVLSGGTFINNGIVSGGTGASVAYYGNPHYAARPGTYGTGVSINGGVFVDNGVILNNNGTELRATGGAVVIASGATQLGGFVGNANAALEVGGTTTFVLTLSSSTFSGFGALGFASTQGGFGLSGTTLALANGQPITGMVVGDAITLTGFAATSESLDSANHLVLKNSGGTTETLDVSGFSYASQFKLTSNGTNTTLTAAPPGISIVSTPITPGFTLGTGSYAIAVSITNTGTVTAAAGTSPASQDVAVEPAGGNGGTGVSFSGSGEVLTNSGSITGGIGGNGAGVPSRINSITGGAGGAGGIGVALAANDGFTNSGTVTGGAGGLGSAGGYTQDGGAYGLSGNGGYGVVTAAGDTVTNNGVIKGGTGGGGNRPGTGGGGVYLNGGIFTNAGTITPGSGANAVKFGANAATLVAAGNAVFNGNIIANAAVADVLILSGTASSVFSGLGTQVQNFKQIDFASGAAWTIEGNTAGLATGETIAGFTSTDQLILDGFAATTETLSGGVLTLSNGSSTQTLALGASTDNFVAVSNGASTTISINPSSISPSTGNPSTGSFAISGHTSALNNATITGFTANDTITLEGFSAASGTFEPGIGLVLGGTEILNITSTAGTGFVEQTDGTNTTITARIATIVTSIATGISLSPAVYATPLTIASTGAVTGGIEQAAITTGPNDTLFNFGSLTGGNGPASGYGNAGQTGKIRAGYTAAAAISSTGAVNITNTNIITGGTGGAGGSTPFNNGISGGNGGLGGDGIFVSAALTLANSGTITGGAGGNGGSTYDAQGGDGGTGAAGIYGGNASTITNNGTITGGGAGNIGGHRAFNGANGSAGSGGAGVTLAGGTLINAGLIAGGNGAAAVQFGAHSATLVIESGASFIGAVTANAGAGDLLEFDNASSLALGSSFTGFAAAQVVNGALVTLSGTLASPLQNNGTIDTTDGTTLLITGALTGTGTLIDDPSSIVLDGSVSSGQTISFSGTGGIIELGDPAQFNGTITGFTAGDTLLADSFTVSTSSFANGQLILNGTNAEATPETLTINIAVSLSPGESFSTGTSGGNTQIEEVTCYATGTRITTARGEVAVETLAIGDLLPTLHAGLQPIKWIGTRSYAAPFANHAKVLPIRIQAGALADGIPARDLYVSPGHAICIDDALIHAARLINGVSITQAESVELITYFHIEMENHEIIFAENCPAETFMGEYFRKQFHNAGEFSRLYPDAAAPETSCLPVLLGGLHLRAIHRRLAARAGIDAAEAIGTLRGYLDAAGPDICHGWAQDEAAPEEPVLLDIFVDDKRIGRVMANLYRADVQAAGYGSGHHGFEFCLSAGQSETLEIRRAADGARLTRAAENEENALAMFG